MNKVLTKYIRQRMRPVLIMGLAVYLFLFSRPTPVFNIGSLITFGFLIGFISVFRLYDDLMQAENDLGKPERDYTDPAVQKTLLFYLVVFFALLVGLAAFYSIHPASLLVGFIIINHLLYLLFVARKTAAGVLPLLKYPFVFILLQSTDFSTLSIGPNLVFPALALFLSFVAFESLEDAEFPVPAKYSYFLQVFSFILIWTANDTFSFFLLAALSLIWTFFRVKAYPYMYLLCFLVFRIINSNF